MNLEKALAAALEASQKAGWAIMEIYGYDKIPGVTLKSDNSPLTLADTTANEIINGILRDSFPDIPILSEEGSSGDSFEDSEYCWIVDPLDGTKEFINRNGEFTVNIALTREHKPLLGVIFVPVTKIGFYAVKGQGAYKQVNGLTEPIRATQKAEGLIWVGSKSHSSDKELRLIEKNRHLIKDTVSVGSSLKGTMIAEGRADIYYRFGLTCEWDTCAMHCIAEEAGGVFRQMDGTEMLYNRKNHLNEKGFFIVNRKENIWI